MKFWGAFQQSGFKTADDLARWLTPGLTCLQQIVTGNVSFKDNISCSLATTQITTAETPIKHTLGYTPLGFLVLNQDAPVIIYASPTSPFNENYIYLQSTGTVNCTIAVIGG